MKAENYTTKSLEAFQAAEKTASLLQHQQLENLHLLKGILDTDEHLLKGIFNQLNSPLSNLMEKTEDALKKLPKIGHIDKHFLSTRLNQTVQKASQYAKKQNDLYISIEHLLYALVEAKDEAGRLLTATGLTTQNLKEAMKDIRKGTTVNSQSAENTYNALERFAQNLNTKASSGKLDPVIGRDDEIRRVLQILARRTKNNPILVGEPGVGKTAIAEGLAFRIVNGDAPDDLLSKQLYSLDMGALVAGAKYKGEFEERLKSVVNEVVQSDGEIVLFIDEIHTLVGAGGGEGAMDAANILKPALARGELRAIGATTLDEYQKYIEKDKALERRFQKVLIDEPSELDAISILRGVKERYETYHKIRIKDEAVVAAVQLSKRYISDRYLPDKAIDLIDEAAAFLRLEANSKPEELDNLDRKLQQLQIEKEAFKREKDTQRLTNLEHRIADLTDERDQLYALWKQEKEAVTRIQKTKQEIENQKLLAQQAERDGQLAHVAEIRYGKLLALETELKDAIESLKDYDNKGQRLVREEIEATDIGEVVSKWTGIPVTKMLESEKAKLLQIESQLEARVIGQRPAIEAIAAAIRRSRAGLAEEHKPIGSFLFLGTTGVGKTELARSLAAYLFNDEQLMTRIDMSEYQEKHTVSRLVGAPPGYVGYEEGGQLTEAVRRKPYSVILLDEIEKAHPDTFNILLQVLEDGRLTDNKGRVADFKNTLIIMTSNLGSQLFERLYEKGDNQLDDKLKEEMNQILKATLRPEFLNRIDEQIVFNPLNKDAILKIVELQINKLQKKLAQQNINLTVTHEAKQLLGTQGYDLQYGARPLKRVIQKELLDRLSVALLDNSLAPNSKLLVSVQNERLEFEKQEQKA